MIGEKDPFIHSSLPLIVLVVLAGVSSVIMMHFGLNDHHITMAQQQSQVNLTSDEKQKALEGISFVIDNTTFSHHTATVNGIQMHYVIGGKGDPVVLLHGYPQSWYEWRYIMPALAKNYTVIAPDLRGFGDSSKPLTGYDGKTTAEDIYQLTKLLALTKSFWQHMTLVLRQLFLILPTTLVMLLNL